MIKSQRGAVTIFFALTVPIFICALVMAWDIGRLYTAKITARHSVILAARAAAAELDLELEDLTKPEDLEPVLKDENEVLIVFKNSLDKNLKYHKDKLFAIEEGDNIQRYITGFLATNTPGEYQVGSRRVQISQPAVAAEIEVPVEMSLLGALVMGNKNDNEVTVKAFTITAPEIREEIDH